ncbi:hypothetical protein BDF19DRAFT_181617 [Syncephalis fuscata]|nr:hypothetical protein BDF19DRAFT_181617 [Syncephalis fuscata]
MTVSRSHYMRVTLEPVFSIIRIVMLVCLFCCYYLYGYYLIVYSIQLACMLVIYTLCLFNAAYT